MNEQSSPGLVKCKRLYNSKLKSYNNIDGYELAIV